MIWFLQAATAAAFRIDDLFHRDHLARVLVRAALVLLTPACARWFIALAQLLRRDYFLAFGLTPLIAVGLAECLLLIAERFFWCRVLLPLPKVPRMVLIFAISSSVHRRTRTPPTRVRGGSGIRPPEI
jgi:hypothetical protein